MKRKRARGSWSQHILRWSWGLALVLGATGQAAAQNVTVNLTSAKQVIRGFGGMNHPIWAGDLTAAQRTTAFGNDAGQLGMTVLRIFISDNKNDWTKEVATAQRASELGAIVFATPWNPPASMTETVSGRKRLRLDQYAAWATYLSDFNTFMKNNGVNLYAVSIQNEPDYAAEWTSWTQDEVYNFVLNNAGSINAERVITPESFNYTKSYYDKILNDPKALANIDIVGTHLYGTPISGFPYPLFDQKGSGKDRWMTEHYTDSKNDADLWPMALDVAYEMHNAMVEGQFNAYVWWYIRRSYSPMKENGQLSKRGYCFAQFSKFVRPGYVRVDATKNPTTDVYVSAYKGSSDVVLVIVNRATASKSLAVSVSGSSAASYERYTTSSSKSLSNEAAVPATNGSLSLTVDAQSVTTLRASVGAGSGGGSSTGGAANVGGGSSTGGAANMGGSANTGGTKSSGGSANSGGTAGTAGASGKAGSTSSGGAAGNAGSANGGSTSNGNGGGASNGGATSNAGSTNSAGSINGSGGAGVGAGGTNSGSGGATTTAGANTASGGRSGSGGNATSGGETNNAGTVGTAGSGSDASGCSCRTPGRHSQSRPFEMLSLLGLLALSTARRRRKSSA